MLKRDTRRGRRQQSPSRPQRKPRVEPLETRRLMAADLQDSFDSLDVNHDGAIDHADAAAVIEALNQAAEARRFPRAANGFPPRADALDTNRDKGLSPADALRVINALPSSPAASAASLSPTHDGIVHDNTVAVSLVVHELDETPGIAVNESFDVQVHFTDLSRNQSVFAAYTDVNFDPARLQIEGIRYSDHFAAARTGTIDNELGIVDELGATDGLGAIDETHVVTLRMKAIGGGESEITTDAGDDSLSQIVIFGSDLDQRDHARFESLDLSIEGPGGSPREPMVDLFMVMQDLDGTPGIEVGESFDVDVHFRNRDDGRSVFAGYADVNFDPAAVQVDGISYDQHFANARTGTVDAAAGIVDELGATDGLGAIEQTRVLTLHLTAVGAGHTVLTSDAGEDPLSQVVVFGSDEDLRTRTDYGSLELQVDDPAAASPLIDARLVAVPAPSEAGASSLPDRLTAIPVGGTYYVEVWVQDLGDPAAGISGGFVDIEYTTDVADGKGVFAGDFDSLTDGRVDDEQGLVDDLGGVSLSTDTGIPPRWARLGYVELDATALGTASYQLQPGKFPMARTAEGNVPWSRVDLSEPLEVEHVSAAQVDLAVVRTPTATDSAGRASQLPKNAESLHEWEPYWVEVWISTAQGRWAIGEGDVQLRYDSRLNTAQSVEFGAAVSSDRTSSIDDVEGMVHLRGMTDPGAAAADGFTLLGRIQFSATAEDDVPVDREGRSLGPHDPGLRVERAEVQLRGAGSAASRTGPLPATRLWAVPYDVDDNGRIDVGDFSFFSAAFNQSGPDADESLAWWADFDRSGRVDVGDFSYFAPNFGVAKPSGAITLPPDFYAQWDAQLRSIVDELPESGTDDRLLTALAAGRP